MPDLDELKLWLLAIACVMAIGLYVYLTEIINKIF